MIKFMYFFFNSCYNVHEDKMKKVLKSLKIILLVMAIFVSFTNSFRYEAKVHNNNPNKTVDEIAMALKINEFDYDSLYSAKDTYNGDITGYVYNCPLCNGTLACLSNYNIKDGTNTYDDVQYGKVNIVASSANLPCGSIVRFEAPRISNETIYAIVLDRGVPGNDLDFLAPDYDYAISNVGRFNTSYDVLRSGWADAN